MRIKTSLLAGTALVAVSAISAFASDLPAKNQPAAAPVVKASTFNWTGLSIGIGGGASWNESKSSIQTSGAEYSYSANIYASSGGYASFPTNYEQPSTQSLDSDLGKFGGFATAQIGADYQAGGVVFGAFGDYNFGRTTLHSLSMDNPQSFWYTYETSDDSGTATNARTVDHKVDFNDSWDVGGRLGVLVNNNNTLLYVLAGYSSADIKATTNYSVVMGNDGPNSTNVNGGLLNGTDTTTVAGGWRNGYILGGGIETVLGDHWTLKTEYRYANYGSITSTASDVSGASFDSTQSGYCDANYCKAYSVSQKDELTTQSVRAVLSYKF